MFAMVDIAFSYGRASANFFKNGQGERKYSLHVI